MLVSLAFTENKSVIVKRLLKQKNLIMDIKTIVKTIFLLAAFVWSTSCATTYDGLPLKIRTDTDDIGTMYSIVDNATDSLIYDSGHNELILDTLINNCYIFLENLWTEECSHRLIVYDVEQSLLMRTGIINSLDFDDFNTPEIETLDIENRSVSIRFYNGKVADFDLNGERYGDYWVDYSVYPSNIVADEVVLSPGDTVKVMNNYLKLVVSYKGKWICDRIIQSTSFDGTIDSDRCILAPTGKVWFKTESDKLVASTGMYENDSDCGYLTEMIIDPEGNISLYYVANESLLGFDDLVYDLRDKIAQEELIDYTVQMNFYNEASSSPEEYAHLFVFYLDNMDSSALETVDYKFYEMLIRYPGKVREMEQYIESLPADLAKEVKVQLMIGVASEYILRTPDEKKPSVEVFMKAFPYFNDPECVKAYLDPDFG